MPAVPSGPELWEEGQEWTCELAAGAGEAWEERDSRALTSHVYTGEGRDKHFNLR